MQNFFATDRFGQMYPYQHSSSNTLSSTHPRLPLPPQAPTSFPFHVACMHVQSIPLSLLLH